MALTRISIEHAVGTWLRESRTVYRPSVQDGTTAAIERIDAVQGDVVLLCLSSLDQASGAGNDLTGSLGLRAVVRAERSPAGVLYAYQTQYNQQGDEATEDLENGKVTFALSLGPLSYPITSLSQVGKTFTIAGDYSAQFAAGDALAVRDSTGNDGEYIIAADGIDYAAGETTITVTASIASATADGSIIHSALQHAAPDDNAQVLAYVEVVRDTAAGEPQTLLPAFPLYLHAQLDNGSETDASGVAPVGAIPLTDKGAANGVASLDADGKVPAAQLPTLEVDATSIQGVPVSTTAPADGQTLIYDAGNDEYAPGTPPGGGIDWRGEWSTGTYSALAAVSHNGSSWIASIETSGEPGVSGDWDVLSEKGEQGPQGETGPAGPSGGRTILSGTSAPTSGDGSDGDFWLLIVDGYPTTIYGPKASGAWPAGQSLVGPQGEQGEQGDPGELPALAALDEVTSAVDNDLFILERSSVLKKIKKQNMPSGGGGGGPAPLRLRPEELLPRWRPAALKLGDAQGIELGTLNHSADWTISIAGLRLDNSSSGVVIYDAYAGGDANFNLQTYTSNRFSLTGVFSALTHDVSDITALHDVAIAWDVSESKIELYIDGASVGSRTGISFQSSVLTTLSYRTLGGSWGTSLLARVQGVRVWTRCLSSTEVSNIHIGAGVDAVDSTGLAHRLLFGADTLDRYASAPPPIVNEINGNAYTVGGVPTWAAPITAFDWPSGVDQFARLAPGRWFPLVGSLDCDPALTTCAGMWLVNVPTDATAIRLRAIISGSEVPASSEAIACELYQRRLIPATVGNIWTSWSKPTGWDWDFHLEENDAAEPMTHEVELSVTGFPGKLTQFALVVKTTGSYAGHLLVHGIEIQFA